MVDQINFPTPQAYSGGADFSQLANLGNVYQAAQEKARQQAALASLGSDPAANAQALIGSGSLPLAQLGMQTQMQQRTHDEQIREFQANLALRQAENQRLQAAETRTASDWKENTPEGRIGKLVAAGLDPKDPAYAAHIASGAPLPNILQLHVDQRAAADEARRQADFERQQRDQAAVPGLISGLLPGAARPPTPAPALTNDPNQITPPFTPEGASAPDAAARAAAVTPGQPAAPGFSREQLGEMYRNPETRPLAQVLLQNITTPGTWKIEKTDDGRVIAINDRDPTKSMDVTPPTATGAPPVSKQERDLQGNYQAALKLFNGDTTKATAYVANGNKLPGENLSVHDSKAVDDNDNVFMSASTAIDNINKLQDLSKKAFQGFGASALGEVTKQFGPGAGTATAEYNNIALRNVVAMVKASFPRPTEYETKLMKMVETGADMPREQRDDLLSSLKSQLQIRANEAQAKSDAIRNRTYYKPGGGDTTAAAVAAGANTGVAPPPSSAKPSLSDFMTKARTANPGVPDGDLARYWKNKYGG